MWLPAYMQAMRLHSAIPSKNRERNPEQNPGAAQEMERRKYDTEAERDALVPALRDVSRQEYLKKREEGKLEELRQALEDEEALFAVRARRGGPGAAAGRGLGAGLAASPPGSAGAFSRGNAPKHA